MLDRLEFLLSEAFTAFRRNWWMTFAAITTSCMALYLTGGVAFAYRGINQYASEIPSRFEIKVFLKKEVSPAQAGLVRNQINKFNGVKAVVWTSKEEAWKKFKSRNPSIPTQGLDNPLPETLTVTLTSVEKADEVAKTIQSHALVAKDGVQYLRREREMISQALGFLRILGLSLGTLMVLTSAVLIYNAIRMTIIARKREFRIMRLVGASGSTILVPLLIEGSMKGLIGGALAGLLVIGTHWYFKVQLVAFDGIIKLGDLSSRSVLLSLSLAGAVYGLVCSAIAARDYKQEV